MRAQRQAAMLAARLIVQPGSADHALASQALQDVAAGNVPFLFDQLTAGLPLVQSGKLKFLAVTTAKRSALAPDVPTTAALP